MTIAAQQTHAAPVLPLQPGPAARARARSTERAPWQRRYVRRLAVGDAAVVAASTGLAVLLRSNPASGPSGGLSYAALAALVTLAWLVSLAAGRAYELRFLGTGSEEYKRVANASLHLVAAVALLALALQMPLARSFVALALLFGTAMLLVHRFVARRLLYVDRRRGLAMHRVVALGTRDEVTALMSSFRRDPHAGFDVVGTCRPDESDLVVDLVDELGADTIAVTASAGITPDVLRRIAWRLEGSAVSLVVAPALTDVAGPRIAIRPVAGLPLLHVEQPDITGLRYLVKEVVERAIGIGMLLVALPVMAFIAAAIKMTSPGPVLFSQTRVSRHGREFRIFKFRSMRVDAEALLEELQAHNDAGGLLFKIRNDPRVTSVGRLLRKWSLDELPQLLNVVRGDMSLVGPRPPLPCEVAGYTDGVGRRLLVKPGMTGLWQVSGRSDLSWEESVRLDLYYVENWSLSLDLQILWRTFAAVVSSAGAY